VEKKLVAHVTDVTGAPKSK